MAKAGRKPKLAVWKFASCDGCQLQLLELEDELLTLVQRLEVAYFLEASREEGKGPYDVSLVEGSITTAHDAKRIQKIRRQSKFMASIGACATSGGIQALRNFAQVEAYAAAVYPHPEFIKTLKTSTPISDHVAVDFELRGCPIDKQQLLELLDALLLGRRPQISDASVCMECKQRGTVCVMVAQQRPCLGPVTHAGCGAICPTYNRGCYGCFGPQALCNGIALRDRWLQLGVTAQEIVRAYSTFNVNAKPFAKVRQSFEPQDD